MTTPSLLYNPSESATTATGEGHANPNTDHNADSASDRVIYASPLALSIPDNDDTLYQDLQELEEDEISEEVYSDTEELEEDRDEYLQMSPFLSSLSHDTPLSKLISSVLLQQSTAPFSPSSPLMDLTSSSSHSKFTSQTGNNSSLTMLRALEKKLFDLQACLLDENGNKKLDSPEFMKKFSPSKLLHYLDLDRDLEVLEDILNSEDLLDKAPLTLLSR